MLYGEEEGPSLGLLVSMLRVKPLEIFEQAYQKCRTAEAIGPMLAPTLWMHEGRKHVEQNTKMARALLAFRKAIDFMPGLEVEGAATG